MSLPTDIEQRIGIRCTVVLRRSPLYWHRGHIEPGGGLVVADAYLASYSPVVGPVVLGCMTVTHCSARQTGGPKWLRTQHPQLPYAEMATGCATALPC